AIIYCRVSSERQVNEGHGLDSQEQRCVAYAQNRGLDVAKIFRDEGISGGLFDRPAMQRLIKHLDEHPEEKFVIIFDDLARFSRDVIVHLQLKTELLIQRKAKLECLNFNFEDSPTGRYVELIMVGAGQLQREQNAEQVKNKMKARLDAGYWTFCPPPGLANQKHPTKGKILMPFEPYATIYKEAIEQYRDYKLNSLEAVRSFILENYAKYEIKRPLSLSGADRILKELLYTGYMEYEPWGVARKKGQHEGFISYETYLAVQDRLTSKAKPRLRKDYDSDFPIRGFVLCFECRKPMTSFWGKGNGGKYAYYKCKKEDCSRKNNTIRSEVLEKEFDKLLRKVRPQPEVLKYIELVLKDAWKNRSQQEQAGRNAINHNITDLETKNAALTTRITKTSSEALIGEYEKTIAANLVEVQKLNDKLAKTKYHQNEFQTALGAVLDFVGSPIKQWESKNYKKQRL